MVVIGVGNHHAGDDAAGLAVAELLRVRGLPAGIAVREASGDMLGLLEAWSGAAAAVLVDAAHSGAAPGTIHRAEAGAGPLPASIERGSSTHAIGVAEAIELGRALDRLPGRLVVYAVEGAGFALGLPLSAPVAAAVPGLAARVLREAVELRAAS